MKISNYEIWWMPKSENVEIIKKRKPCASVDTYSNVAYFSWPPLLEGQKVNFEWENMSTEQFNALDTLYQADNEDTLDLVGDGTTQYKVRILNLTGTYFVSKYENENTHRRNVKMELLIMGQVVQ